MTFRNPSKKSGLDAGMEVCENNCLQVPFKELSEARYQNTVALAVISDLIGSEPSRVLETLKEPFGKHPEEPAENRKALEAGFRWAGEHRKDKLSLPVLSKAPRRPGQGAVTRRP